LDGIDVWSPTINADGTIRDGAWVAEVTHLLDLSRWPTGSRVILRKERPHPGAQLTFTDVDGHRITGFITDTPCRLGNLARAVRSSVSFGRACRVGRCARGQQFRGGDTVNPASSKRFDHGDRAVTTLVGADLASLPPGRWTSSRRPSD
jgi:hypothetical protein